MGQATTVVDRVLRDSLAIPPGTDRWLRLVEGRIKDAQQELNAVAAGDLVITRLSQVQGRLNSVLADESASPFFRLLRRPLSQLGLGSPAQAAFDAYAEQLLKEAKAAVDAQKAVNVLRAQRDRIHEQWRDQMPYLTRLFLERARVSDAECVRVQRVSDARLIARRLEIAEAYLVRFAAHLPPLSGVEPHLRVEGLGELSTRELWAALQLHLRKRASSERPTERTERLRHLQARQIEYLRAPARPSRPATTAEAAAEHLAQQSLEQDGRNVSPWDDGELWSGLIAAAEEGRFTESWQPRISATAADAKSANESDDSVVYAIAFHDDLVYLTSHITGPVHVWSRAVRVGEDVELRIFGKVGSATPIAIAQCDLLPIFDGLDIERPAWYITEKRAHVRVLCPFRGGWFARVSRKGTIDRLPTPPWQDSAVDPTAVRVVTAGPGTLGAPRQVQVLDEDVPSLFGLETWTVGVSAVGEKRAWLRAAKTEWGREAVTRERDLFRALRSRSPHATLASSGWGEAAPRRLRGVLYRIPFGYHPASAEPVRSWVAAEPAAFLRALLKIFVQVQEAGWALGLWHMDMFAFSVIRRPVVGGEFVPRAILVTAPFAVPFGHTSPLTAPHTTPPIYPKLGLVGYPPAIATGGVALPETDAAALALLSLELLASRSLSQAPRTLSWSGVASLIENHRDAFARPRLAQKIARGLTPGPERASVRAFFESLAGD